MSFASESHGVELSRTAIVENMPSSRRFLLVLLLVSVMCIVVVQVTLDGWNLRTSSSPYSTNSHSVDSVHNGNSSMLTSSNKSKATVKLASSSSSVVTPLSKINQKPVFHVNSSHQVKGQVRRLPLGRDSSKHVKEQLLVSRQERLQEILKQSSAIHRRPTIDPRKSLRSMPVVDPKNVTRIFIITYFRAGSSFFGDLLQQNWKTFYHFEPLHSMTYDSRIGDEKVPEVFDLFNGIFKCKFTEMKDYVEWVRQPRNQFLFAHNLFLWVTCHSNPKTCFNPSFVSDVCDRAPIHVIKVTRLHMHHLRKYLENNPDLNIKVVYLTRDPRGIVSSRWSLDWCNGTNCSDPSVLCHEMYEDMKIFQDLQRKQPSNFVEVRYEDLSMNPKLEAQKLFTFLKLPFSTSVQRFLKTHTVGRRSDNNNPYSTRRNTMSMAFSWRERFTFKQVVDVQSSCKDVLIQLNHSLITSPEQLPYPNGKTLNISVTLNKPEIKIYSKNPLYLKLRKKYLHDSRSLINYSNNKSVPFQHKDHEAQILNNTNIEIHKTIKVINFTENTLKESMQLKNKEK